MSNQPDRPQNHAPGAESDQPMEHVEGQLESDDLQEEGGAAASSSDGDTTKE